jgi:hypothetical protein
MVEKEILLTSRNNTDTKLAPQAVLNRPRRRRLR